MKTDGAAYREYKCSPSEQFEGFTWCQRARNDQDRRGAFTAKYSVLHAQDGRVVYVNRIQDPAFIGRNEAEKDVQQHSRSIGEPARITKMPHRAGLPDAMIVVWGAAALEPLDQDSIRTLAEGRSPKKGLLIDFIGNFSRSAKEGLPVYRIGGGAGLLLAVSFDQQARGTWRLTAADASGLPSRLPEQAPDAALATPQLASAAEENIAEPRQTVAIPKPDLAESANQIAQLEKATAETEQQSRIDNSKARQARGRTEAAETRTSDSALEQWQAENAALRAENRTWQTLAYAAIISLVALLTSFISVRLARWRNAAKASRKLSQGAVTPAPALIAARTAENPQAPALAKLARELELKDSHAENEEPEAEIKTGSGVDRDELVNQLAETLGVQESGVQESGVQASGVQASGIQASGISLSELTPAVSESVVPESAADGTKSSEGTKPGLGGELAGPVKQMEPTAVDGHMRSAAHAGEGSAPVGA